ncbi:hypothetical protein [Blautia wexlerae]|uniref:hypothetical protein n=1 Tax=Blautia wexlerae TaxID=418240 RepID=UPI0012E25B14|nr:hypothetical protein [Blautia wexlerae]
MDAEIPELGSGIESADRPLRRTAYCLSVREKKSRNGEALLSPAFLLSVYSFGIYIIARNFRSYSRGQVWAEPTKGNNDYDVYLEPGEYYALIDYSEGVDVKVPISIRVPDETPVLTKTGPDRYEATCELLRNLYTMPIKLLPLLLNIKKYSKKDPGCYTQSLSFLGICINYPNGLFNFSSFQI